MARAIRSFDQWLTGRPTGFATRAAVLVAFAACVGACGPAAERLNSPPQGWSSRQAAMQEHYVHMVDNAMLAARNVSDVHFVPHTGVLNALGARRLDRYAALLKEYGGRLVLDTEGRSRTGFPSSSQDGLPLRCDDFGFVRRGATELVGDCHSLQVWFRIRTRLC